MASETQLQQEEIRPCLIGGFCALSYTSPSYFNRVAVGNGRVASVDMVRVGLSVDGQKLSDAVFLQPVVLDVSHWVGKVKVGSWHELYTFNLGESSVTLGIGLVNKSCRIDMSKAFVELNPNKVAGDERLTKLLGIISKYVTAATLKRFDLAFDVRVTRDCCRVTKDMRTYQSVVSNGITEYLGVRNTSGFVKVYDKAAELAKKDGVTLDGPMTRIELTCSGDWSADELLGHWPLVHAWSVPDGTKDWVKVVGILIAEKAERGEDVETLVNMLGRRSRAKVRESLSAPMVELPREVAEMVLVEAHEWAERVMSGVVE